MIFPLVRVRCLSLLLLLCYCQFLLLRLLMFVICIEVLLCWVQGYLQLLWLPLGLIPINPRKQCPSLSLVIFFILRSIFSDMRIITPAFFLFPFAQNIFFPSSHFQSLELKQVSYRQHIYGSCFCIHSASLCLLVEAINLFTFKVIIDIYVPIAIFLIVWGWFYRSFFFFCIS